MLIWNKPEGYGCWLIAKLPSDLQFTIPTSEINGKAINQHANSIFKLISYSYSNKPSLLYSTQANMNTKFLCKSSWKSCVFKKDYFLRKVTYSGTTNTKPTRILLVKILCIHVPQMSNSFLISGDTCWKWFFSVIPSCSAETTSRLVKETHAH